jgi:hypothetical protein
MAGQPRLLRGPLRRRLAFRCLRSQRDSFKSAMTKTTALRRLYENHHYDDLTALKRFYEHHAEDCVRMAALTFDPQQRVENLILANGWTEAAAALGAPKEARPFLAASSARFDGLDVVHAAPIPLRAKPWTVRSGDPVE